MHILLVHQAFTAVEEPGGTRHHEFARHLVEKGHQVTIIASPISYLTGKKTQDEPTSVVNDRTGLRIIRVKVYSALHRSFFHRVLNFLSFMVSSFIAGMKVRQVDIVWGTSPPIFQALTSWALARIKGVPFLFEVRDLWPAFAIAVGVLKNPVLQQISLWVERILYRQASCVMINSPGFKEHVVARGAGKVVLVPNGSDPRMFDTENDGESFRQSNQLSDHYVVMYAGAHGLSNDLGIVLKAAKILEGYPKIRFVLLGDGKDKPALIRQAKEYNLTNVVFIDPVAKKNMPQALAAADACIAILKPIPLYATVYPNKVFDYMAASRPVILAIDGVIKKVIESVQGGLHVPPGNAQAMADAVLELHNNPERGIEMGRRGREYVETNFDRAVLAEKLEQIIQNLVHSR